VNVDTLSIVQWGDPESLQEFLFENGQQHKLFQEYLLDDNIIVPRYPIFDLDFSNIDDWLLLHQVEHQAFAAALELDNPFNMLDTDWRIESDFYDWIANHVSIHRHIIAALGISST